ncbi:MAG: hypothetical protein Q7V63_06565 [Gammaproteobacteria bacterium]|nr:hypothetical protein [Gammaproteobacteria bacterium]
MKEDDDNFNFDDDFEPVGEETTPPGATDESPELLPADEFTMDEADESSGPAKSSSGLVSFLKANLVFILVGLVGVAIAGYLTYGILVPSTPQQKQSSVQAQPSGFGLKPVIPEPDSAQANAKKTSATPAPATGLNNTMPVAVPTPIATTPANIIMTQQDMKTLMEGFAKVVNQNSQDIFTKMQDLEGLVQDVGQASLAQQKQTVQVVNTLGNMQKSMQTLSANLAAYNKNMIIVAKELDKTQQQLALLLAEQSATVQKLTLRAVVPGRAWLVDDQGNTTTVVLGTALANYGTVVNIDSGKGEVVMSTGYVFK